MAAHQAPPSLGFSRQEHWSGLPFPSPMHEREKWKWSCSVVSDSLATPETAAHQAPPSMGFLLLPPKYRLPARFECYPLIPVSSYILSHSNLMPSQECIYSYFHQGKSSKITFFISVLVLDFSPFMSNCLSVSLFDCFLYRQALGKRSFPFPPKPVPSNSVI